MDNGKPENLSLDKDFKLVKHDHDYAIYVPKYMKEAKDLNEEASLQYQNLFKETYLVIIDEPKDEFINTFEDIGEYNDSISPIKNYKNIQDAYYNNVISITKKYDDESTKIHGLDAEIVKFDGKINDVGIAYDIAYIEGKNNIYMILVWTLDKRRSKYANTFDKIITSFKEIN